MVPNLGQAFFCRHYETTRQPCQHRIARLCTDSLMTYNLCSWLMSPQLQLSARVKCLRMPTCRITLHNQRLVESNLQESFSKPSKEVLDQRIVCTCCQFCKHQPLILPLHSNRNRFVSTLASGSSGGVARMRFPPPSAPRCQISTIVSSMDILFVTS